MKVVGYILGACVVLALVRAVAAALVITLLLVIIVGVVTKPRETFGLLLFLLLTGAIQTHAVALIVGLVTVFALGLVARVVANRR